MNNALLGVKLVDASASADERPRHTARVAAAIRRFAGYGRVDVYDVTPDAIAVVGPDGPAPPAHPRFFRGDGLCGAAAAQRRDGRRWRYGR